MNVSVNYTMLVIQIANFLILIFILNQVLYKPIRKMLQQRKIKVNGLNASISVANKDAEEKGHSFTAGIKAARTKGQKSKEALMQGAAEEQRALIAQINAKAKEDLDAAKNKIAEDAHAVKEALEKEIATFANAITQKILGRAA